MPSKILPGNETVLLIPAIEVLGVPFLVGATTLIDFDAPTAAVLNRYLAIVSDATTNWGAGGNVSCALRDDMTLGLTDSDTDSDRTICSVGNSEALTYINFEAEFNVFRDESLTSTSSVFNMAYNLIKHADIPYVIAHRIGLPSTTNAAIGQEWDFYYVWTDNPVPVYEDGGNQLATASFVPKNLVNIAYELVA